LKKVISRFSVLFLAICISCSLFAQDEFPVLKGPYLGQKPPGITPEVFAPGIISTGYDERMAVFTLDGKEFYYQLWGVPHPVILTMKEKDGYWTKPKVASFSGQYMEAFNIAPDGKKMIVASPRPLDRIGKPLMTFNIWIVERSDKGWGELKPLNPSLQGYPAIAKTGNLYLGTNHLDELGGDEIYISKYSDGKYSKPVNLGDAINSEFDECDPFIAPDESYIIFCRVVRSDEYSGADLYISFRKKDSSWTKAKNMGEKINSSAWQYCPCVSSDGKYLFFTSNRRTNKSFSKEPITYEEKIKILNSPGNGSEDIYWVDVKVIEELKPDELK